ncbi:MAG: DEAD/DEAH box helicase [Pseudomonadota bacterium]
MSDKVVTQFDQLSLMKPILKALDSVGYESPTPIQAKTIPHLLKGRDLIGMAQTGTGKTAAFALPILNTLDCRQRTPQVLVLTPTRELALQVAEAFKTYAAHIGGFSVLPIYGGQEYRGQIRALKRGIQVVVGTPGRVMDHMKRNTLKLGGLKTLVLDEADEMLRMGFIEDVEWILSQTPVDRQVALFSATMPTPVKKIAEQHLRNPIEVTTRVKTVAADTIRQRYWSVQGQHKLDTLTRILEAEPFDAMIIFVRTKRASTELADKLEARGYGAAALNGDIAQGQREQVLRSLRNGKIDILVATDVAARGLDVDRISHVLNYDIPHDPEAYIHRIGRTGRAGRRGEAILFVAPREKRMLASIERSTGAPIKPLSLPSNDRINERRIERFKQNIRDNLEEKNLALFKELLSELQTECDDVDMLDIAAALANQLQGDAPFLLAKDSKERQHADVVRVAARRSPSPGRSNAREKSRTGAKVRREQTQAGRASAQRKRSGSAMCRYRLEVGRSHDVRPSQIVGAIANECGLGSGYIGKIEIHENHSTVDLPEGMPRALFKKLKKAWVSGQRLQIRRLAQS